MMLTNFSWQWYDHWKARQPPTCHMGSNRHESWYCEGRQPEFSQVPMFQATIEHNEPCNIGTWLYYPSLPSQYLHQVRISLSFTVCLFWSGKWWQAPEDKGSDHGSGMYPERQQVSLGITWRWCLRWELSKWSWPLFSDSILTTCWNY